MRVRGDLVNGAERLDGSCFPVEVETCSCFEARLALDVMYMLCAPHKRLPVGCSLHSLSHRSVAAQRKSLFSLALITCFTNVEVSPVNLKHQVWHVFQTLTGDLEGTGSSYTPAVSFNFEALTCTGSCDIATSVETLDGESSDGSTGRTMAIVVGSVVSGVGVAAIVIIGALLLRRRKRDAKTKGAGSTEDAAPADPSAPAPIPVFEVRRPLPIKVRVCVFSSRLLWRPFTPFGIYTVRV